MTMFVASALIAEIVEEALCDHAADFEDVLSICNEDDVTDNMGVGDDEDYEVFNDAAKHVLGQVMMQHMIEPAKPMEEQEPAEELVPPPAKQETFNFMPSVGTWHSPLFRAKAVPTAVEAPAATPVVAVAPEPVPLKKDFRFLASVGTWHSPSFVAPAAPAKPAEEQEPAEEPVPPPSKQEAFNFMPSIGTWHSPIFRAKAAPTAVEAPAATPMVAPASEPVPVRKDFRFLASVGTWHSANFVAPPAPAKPVEEPKPAQEPVLPPAKQEAFNFMPSVGTWHSPLFRAKAAPTVVEAPAATPVVAPAPEPVPVKKDFRFLASVGTWHSASFVTPTMPTAVEVPAATPVAAPAPEPVLVRKDFRFLASVGTWHSPSFVAQVTPKLAEGPTVPVESAPAPANKDFRFLASVGTWMAPSIISAREPATAEEAPKEAPAPAALPIEEVAAEQTEEPSSPLVLAGTAGRSLMKMKKSLSSSNLLLETEAASPVQGSKKLAQLKLFSKKPSTMALVSGLAPMPSPSSTPAWMLDLDSSEVALKQVFKAPTTRPTSRSSSVGSMVKKNNVETPFSKAGLLPAIQVKNKNSLSQWTIAESPALRRLGV